MAGFMSGGLGFASGMGSFITGAAAKENQILDQQRKQGREDDLIWQEKFERGMKDYDKEKKDTDTQARMYNTFLSLSKGNKMLADVAMNHVIVNPKGYEDAVQMLTKNAGNQSLNDPGYQSSFMGDLNSNLSGKYDNLQRAHDNLNPNAQRNAPMPQQPQFPNSDYSQPGPQAQPGQPPQAQPNGPPQQQSTNAPGPGQPPQIQPVAGSPDQMIPNQGQQPQSPVQPIPAPSPSLGAVPNSPPTQTAQNQGLYGPKPETQRQQEQTDIARQQLQINKDRFDMERTRKPATPEEAANYTIQTNDAEKYLHDPKTGLQARYGSLQDLQSSNYSISSIRDVLERGFKANSVQGAYDEFNRFFQGMFGTDLSTMGLKVNPTEDINVFKKDVSNAIIDRLKTLHFGRITNYEASIVKQGFSNPTNDPNTNIKIALTMQSSIRAAMQGIQVEYDKAFGQGRPTLDTASDARRSGIEFNKKYITEHENAPWPQFNDTEHSLPMIGKMEQGTWFEDKKAGKMYRSLGMQNNFLKLEDAAGQTYTIPMH